MPFSRGRQYLMRLEVADRADCSAADAPAQVNEVKQILDKPQLEAWTEADWVQTGACLVLALTPRLCGGATCCGRGCYRAFCEGWRTE